jgi:hypothetical protein
MRRYFFGANALIVVRGLDFRGTATVGAPGGASVDAWGESAFAATVTGFWCRVAGESVSAPRVPAL